MQLHRALRKATELGIGLTAIATLILAGCGGGGSSATSTASTVSAVTTSVTPYKGRFTDGAVTLKDANGNTITLLNGSGSINASGVATVSYNGTGVAYPLTVEVTGTYIDETTGASTVLGASAPLTGIIAAASDAVAASGVPVTAVTHMARQSFAGYNFTPASAVAAITAVASNVLGITSYADAMKPPVFNVQGQTSDPLTIKLTALADAIAQQGTGATLHAKLHDIAGKLAAGSAVNAVINQTAFQNALSAYNGGASSVLPAGATAPVITPPTLPGSNLNTLIAGTIPSCTSGQMLQITSTGLQCVSTPSGGGNTGGTPTASTSCNTSLFSGGVSNATSNQMASYAQTYSGNTGSFDQNFNFTSSGAATLVFGSGGTLSYNGQAQTVTSICYETAVPQLVVHFGTGGHVDLKTDGSFTGMAPDGMTVIRSAAASNPVSNVTNLTVPAGTAIVSGAARPSQSFSSAATISYTPLLNQPGNIITISENGITTTVYDYVSTNQIGFSVTQSGFSIGLSPYNGCATTQAGVTAFNPLCSSVGVTYDRAAGTITFSNAPMYALVGTCSANCVVNGTLAFAPQ